MSTEDHYDTPTKSTFMKKFVSRKFLIAIATAICDILIAASQIPAEIKPLLLKLITTAGGGYIIVEGIIDLLREKENH